MDLQLVIAIDPGTDKCGVAVVDRERGCLHRSVESAAAIADVLHVLAARHPGARLVIGDGTGSRSFAQRLREAGVLDKLGEPIFVDEHRSSEEARRLYLERNRKGWRKWIPLGLQTPREPIDDYVAEVLAHRCFAANRGGQGR